MEFYTDFAEQIFRTKYLQPSDEGKVDNAVRRVLLKALEYSDIKWNLQNAIDRQQLVPAGGIWRAAGNPVKHISFVNCTTGKEVEDNIESIFESLYYWAKFSAFGQGQGVDISKLRPAGTPLHNTARTSTGGVSFMPLYDAVLKVIAQHGRRGATLISIHDTYPDFEAFCKIKSKAGEVESANISIQTSDAFMQAMIEGKEWKLLWEGDGMKVEKTASAKDLFKILCENAHAHGDPGMLYWDTSRRESNSDALGFPIVCTNACSEVPQDAHNTCLLSSLNLVKICEDWGNLSYEVLASLTKLGIRFLDAMLEAEYAENRSPSVLQHEKLRLVPRIGLGFTGFADYLILKHIPYGSPESVEEVTRITKVMAQAAYEASYDLGKQKGNFGAYDPSKYVGSAYVRRLLDDGLIDDETLKYQRHMCKLAIAPAGTLSIIANCGGSGIEPLYSKYMVRRERTSGQWKEWFTYSPTMIRHARITGMVLDRKTVDGLTDPWWVTAHTLPFEKKIDVVAAAQKYIDQGISVTHNLPEDAPLQAVEQIFYKCWQQGLKGATVYREGSREGVLVTEANYEKTRKIHARKSPLRPQELDGEVFKQNNYTMIVGLRDGVPYEIFGGKVANGFHSGKIVKLASRTYMLNDMNILEHFHDKSVNAITRLVSLSLRHGVPVQFVCDQLDKEADMFDIAKFFSRTLRKYIGENETILGSHHKCMVCGAGSDSLKYEGGCMICTSCGSSSCS